ncbi:hypothetical protein [Halorubrum coriense]|nr:hypothetical protein [Halorubrum coriense]
MAAAIRPRRESNAARSVGVPVRNPGTDRSAASNAPTAGVADGGAREGAVVRLDARDDSDGWREREMVRPGEILPSRRASRGRADGP